jgi:hypothetical protein
MSEIIEGPSCGTYPYPVTKAPGDPVTGWFCAGSYFTEQADAEHQSEKMKEAYAQGQASKEARVKELEEKLKDVADSFEVIIRNDKTVYNYTGDGAKNRDGLTSLEGRWSTPLEIAQEALKKLKG